MPSDHSPADKPGLATRLAEAAVRRLHSGYRDRAPIAFIAKHNQLVGPLFDISIKGTF